jgi:hypothetical protein
MQNLTEGYKKHQTVQHPEYFRVISPTLDGMPSVFQGTTGNSLTPCFALTKCILLNSRQGMSGLPCAQPSPTPQPAVFQSVT